MENEEEVSTEFAVLKANPLNYDGYLSYISNCQAQGVDNALIRAGRELFSAHFPLTEGEINFQQYK